jgi:23S rRNA (guanosine2251-2'-O)-methyltransferase
MAAAAPLPKRGRRHDRGASGRRPAPTPAAPVGGGTSVPAGRGEIVYGRNAVREVILAGRRRVTHLWVMDGEAGRDLEREVSLWVAEGANTVPPPARLPAQEVTARAGSPDHQGIVVETGPYAYASAETALSAHDLLIALDRIQDPHNLGSIIRTAEEVGAGVVIPRHRTATVTAAVVKASAGATEHATVVQVRNLSDFMAQAKDAGFWVYGAEAVGSGLYDAADYRVRTLFVMGSEGEGLGERVAAACDLTVAIPLAGRVGSLNVGVAAAVLLFEAARQRRAR